MRFGRATSVEEGMRAPCWDLLNWIITHKSKTCVKKGLVAPVVQAAAQCMYVVSHLWDPMAYCNIECGWVWWDAAC